MGTQALLESAGVLVVLYAAVVARQVSFRGPPLWTLFLGAGALLLLLGVLSGSQALGAISLPVLAFLFGMFCFGVALDDAGVLTHLARYLSGRGRSREDLLFYLFVGLGLLSAFLVNDALAVLGTPLLIGLARRWRISASPLLLTLAFAVTVGSASTPMGNPQNLLIALDSGMPHPLFVFLRYLWVPTLVNLFLGGWLVRRWLGPRLRPANGSPAGVPQRIPFWPRGGWGSRLFAHPALVLFPATMALAVVTSVGSALGVLPSTPLDEIIFGGGVLTLLAEGRRGEHLRRIDWGTLLLFVGLFVVMGAMVQGGVVGLLASHIPDTAAQGGQATAIALTVQSLFDFGAVQIFSNVPWVALSLPILQAEGYGAASATAWMTLAAASTLGGNLTFLGAASNLIILNQAEREGVRLSLREFVKYGAPLTFLTVAIALGAILVGI